MIKATFINEEQYELIMRYAIIGQALLENDVEEWSFYWDSLDKFIANEYHDDTKGATNLQEYVEWRKELFKPEKIEDK